jgi:hypothetical protein
MFFLQFCIFAQINNILKLRQHLSILGNIMKSDIRREVDFRIGFATSADMVKEAGGLRLAERKDLKTVTSSWLF